MLVSIELVQAVAIAQLDAEQAETLVREIKNGGKAEAEAAESMEKEPRQKKQFVAILYDGDGAIRTRLGEDRVHNLICTIAQIPEDDDTDTTLDKLHRAAYAYNTSKKGRRHPVKTVGEACEAVGSRFLKEQDLAIKTKEPVRVLVTDGRIPVCVEGGAE